MKTFDPKEHDIPFVQQLIQSGVAPRPIALVSSMDVGGRHNLSPFSFFNIFGSNPPVLVVSPAYRGHDGTPKHSFLNILATREFTVSAVSHSMVEQVSLASGDYAAGVDEFVKAGLTKLPSTLVAPPGVAESPFVMECRLLHHYDTGGRPGAGNLLIAEIVQVHVHESAYENGKLHPDRLDLVARMGGSWYCRASGPAVFELAKPRHAGIGFDALPPHVRECALLSGNDLARLAGVEQLPDTAAIAARWHADLERVPPSSGADVFDVEHRLGHAREALLCALRDFRLHADAAPSAALLATRLQLIARLFLNAGETAMAWECALMSDLRAWALREE
jgi:flavin reductase (DIM6/NTAB) family NADH-FMN oxidoreductase RutF